MPFVADVIYTRDQVIEALQDLNLTKSWLAGQIKESKQSVHNWLDSEAPTEPQDPTVWERMTEVLTRMGRAPADMLTADLKQWAADISIATLTGDTQAALDIAPKILRELTKARPDPRSRKKS